MGITLSLTDLAVKEKRDQLTRIRTKGRLSLETMKIDGTGIIAESNLSFLHDIGGFCYGQVVIHVFSGFTL